MSRKNKKVRMSSRIDLADALRKESSLSAFTFDGPYRLTGHDLLDNMYCADNGRWYETPVDWYGLARAARQTSWHQSALYFKRNVLLGCYIPHPLLSRQDFSAWRWTGLCSVTHSLSFGAICSANHLNYGTHWRNTCDAEAILNHGGMCRMARTRFSFALAKCAT
ncbi:phage portal protein, PBSX family [Escherichia coli P0304777.5]|nr:phage portal protein, PBSX family [Escherichia coli P0304777.5]ENF11449.1 phage portal protein, PBSX family [Escherichia coli P0304777.5]